MNAASLEPALYERLRSLAHRLYARSPAASIEPTMLVHDAWERIQRSDADYESMAHFVAVAARAMRQVLVDHARRRAALKRGGGLLPVSVYNLAESHDPVDMLTLDAALTELDALDPRAAKVVELRFLGGLSIEEVALLMDISPTTVKAEWRSARAWLMKRLEA